MGAEIMRINGTSSANIAANAKPSAVKPESNDKAGEIKSTGDKRDKRIEKLEKMQNNYEMLVRQLETVNAQNGASAKASEIRLKCIKIAMRIMSGDIVPDGDHRFLLENDPELYGKAVMMRIQKENPEKHKRISEDDDGFDADLPDIEIQTENESESEDI